jgi:hypothetical protein
MSDTVLTSPITWKEGYKLSYIENGWIAFIDGLEDFLRCWHSMVLIIGV